MYTKFFGLERNPFELSPDPHFIFATEKIKETLVAIHYAIAQRKGFVVLTGEVGTGKTLMMRWLFDVLKHHHIPFANVFNPRLTALNFLHYVVQDLGITVSEPTKAGLLQALYKFLLAQVQKGLTTVVVIDEAQQLPAIVLEEIRLLTNLETTKQKLVQIILAGQPELDVKLDSYELRQLKQRIAVRCRLEPLSRHEIPNYIERRLELAGSKTSAEAIFPIHTVEAIYRHSSGIPRVINSLCDQALLVAYARGSKLVTTYMVDEVADYFRLQPTSTLQELEKRPANGVASQQQIARSILDVIEAMEKMAGGLRN
jgi:general secretion pathway protein A